MPGWQARHPLQRYGLALALVGVALVTTLLLQHLFSYPFLFLFFAAVILSAWTGGTGVGLFAVLLSTVAVEYFFLPPFYSFTVRAADVAYLVAFGVSALAGSWVSASQRQSREALRHAHDQLELRVAERTAELQQANTDLRDRERQLRHMQGEIWHLSRVMTMGELTTSIAHEVNQPLAAVVNYGNACLEWLSQQPPNLDEARHAAQRIVNDGSRAGAVIGRIRALVKKQPAANEPVDVNELTRELAALVRDEATRQGIALRTDYAAVLPLVEGDRVQLQQVLLNLVVNSIDALDGSTRRPKEILIATAREGSGDVGVRVEDSGVGLTPEATKRIFQPFFTTKPKGIGMGLAISRSIVEAHRGRLWASPRVGGGTIFHFTLPTAPSHPHE